MSWDEILKGSNGADIISGGSGDDFLQGKAGGDSLDGGDGNDQLHGDSGDDHLRGGRGNDDINGGTGTDTAYYSGSVFEYSHHRDGEILYLSHLGGSGFDGSDRLWHVERLVFADAVIDLTIDNAPIAFDDVAMTDEDVGSYSSGAASVLDNDFDWEGDAMSVSPGTFTGAYGTLVLNSDGTYTYTPSAAAQSLAQGETVQDVFTYTVTDGNSTDTGTLTINLAGVNDAPTANPDSATTSENAVVTVDVLANDDDVDNGAVLTVTSASAPAGQGTASVVGNQVQFDPGTEFDHLAVGASVVVVIGYTITDEFGATSSSTVSVTVTGTNDGPVANSDSASTGENAVGVVDVLANDTDVDDGAVLTVTAASAPPGKGSASVVGNQVQFDPGSDFDHLAEGASEIVIVSYTISDEHGAMSSSTVAITVTGTNDGPVANPDTSTTGENSVVTVNVLANDTDADDGAVLTVIAASAPAGQGTASVVGNQVQWDPGTDFDYLAVGETAQVVVGYDIEDEHGASSSSTVTITVNGVNDAPTVDAGGTTATGAVTELANNDPGEGTTIHEAVGTIAFDDLDLSDTHNATVTAQGSGYYGTFTLDAVDQSGNSVGWHFDVGDAEIDGLDEGEVVTQTYTITISDGNGGTTSQDVTITITGAADSVAPDGINWYIDNSAVGSANTGSPSDPFTSIAAFNAAQGSPGGPDAGDNIFLRAGTGTYTESDGINLLDGQTLTGVADGAVRPTIVATAGDGINVAQNNTVSGIDIGDTSGADIADSGGSVGTLTIFDVATFGTGQIIDVDQGGTLAVTLNSAASTASSGGAIDLAGVGGTFTVTGATTITGAHSGGGIDITGSSVAASFAGGGTVATLTTAAVNYVGNSGSLAIGGGLDIVTTSGAGLNASGGGTVTATGSGNSIVSTTGTALSVVGTAIGLAGLTFESISSTGAVNGILLSNTGTTAGVHGGLTVTGDAGSAVNGSGGTITASTGAGISLASTRDVSLDQMIVQNGGNDGIRGNNVVNFTLSNSIVLANGNADEEHGIDMTGLTGTASIDNSTIRGSFEHNFRLLNTGGTLDSLAITASTFDHLAVQSGLAGGSGILITLQGSAIITDLAIVGSTFRNNFSNGILVNTENGSRIGADNATSGSTDGAIVANNTFDDNNIAIQFGVFGSSDITVDIEGNTIVNDSRTDVGGPGGTSTAIVLGTSASSAAGSTLNARVEGNVIGDENIAGSGSSTGSGISLVIQGMADVTALIDGNTIREAPFGFGIDVQSYGSGSGTPPASDVTITDNDVDHTNAGFSPGSDFPLPAIWVYGDSMGTPGRLNLDIRGNTVPSDPSYFFLGTMIEVFNAAGDMHLVDNPFGPSGQTASEQLESSNIGTAAASGVDLDLAGPLPVPPDLFWP